MSTQRKKSILEASSSKKRAVLGADKRKSKFLPYTIFSVIAVLAIAAVVVFQGNALTPDDRGSANTAQTASTDAGRTEVVTHPLSLFDDGMAKHFQLKAQNGITVKYFVLKSSDGVVRAAFDACDVCWPSGKGYFQEQDNMVCRNCGKRFASIKINEIKGGCNPAPLKRKVEGDKLVIDVADILEGTSYFDFKGRTAS